MNQSRIRTLGTVVFGLSMAVAGTAFAQSTPQTSRNGGFAPPAGPGSTAASQEARQQTMRSDEERRALRDTRAANRAATREALGTTPRALGTSMGAGTSANSASTVGSSGMGPAAAVPPNTATQ